MGEHPIPRWLRKQKRYIMIQKIKEERGCKFCPERNPDLLDFHHRDPEHKKATISQIIRGEGDYNNLKRELEKCDVICAKCHRKLHRQEIIENKIKKAQEYKNKYPEKYKKYEKEINTVLSQL